MKKFMALYMAPREMMQEMMKASPEEQQKGMADWNKWIQDRAKDLADPGAPLGRTKRITADGVSEAKNDIGGYSVVQAESAEEAAALFEDNPHVRMKGAWVELIECLPMPSA